jgi:hypothetical protein
MIFKLSERSEIKIFYECTGHNPCEHHCVITSYDSIRSQKIYGTNIYRLLLEAQKKTDLVIPDHFAKYAAYIEKQNKKKCIIL